MRRLYPKLFRNWELNLPPQPNINPDRPAPRRSQAYRSAPTSPRRAMASKITAKHAAHIHSAMEFIGADPSC